MRKRIFSVILLILFFFPLMLSAVPQAQAAGDLADEFAREFRSAVERDLAQVMIDTKHPDVQSLLDDVFVRYPELYHFYDGASWITYSDHAQINVKFKNLHHAFSEICVADSLDSAAYYLRAAIEQGRGEVYINLPGTDFNAAMDEIFRRYPVLFHYYSQASWFTYQNRMEVTLTLKNLQDDFSDIPVVDSDEDLFAVIALGLAELNKEIHFIFANGYTYSEEALARIFSELQLQYHLAYMGHHGWGSSYLYNEAAGVYDYTFTFNYFYDLDAETIRQWRNETEQVALSLAGSLFARDMPDYLKLLLIHDWIINNTRYNIENMEEVGNHTAYGVLVKGSSVCMGYAEAANLLLQAAGIETRYVSGFGINASGHRESHAWNAVKLDGDWYMLDITWDDPVTSDNSNVLRYDYFNVTSAQLAKDHEWDYSTAPQCNGTFYNASYVQQLAQNDTMYYTDYDASTLMTQQKAKQYFQSLLNQIPLVLPQQPVIPVETQPVYQDPIPETIPAIDPDPIPATNPVNEPQPTIPAETRPNPVIEPAPQQREGGGGWIILVVIVLIVSGGGSAAFLIVRKKRQDAYTSRKYEQPFGLDNLPKRY